MLRNFSHFLGDYLFKQHHFILKQIYSCCNRSVHQFSKDVQSITRARNSRIPRNQHPRKTTRTNYPLILKKPVSQTTTIKMPVLTRRTLSNRQRNRLTKSKIRTHPQDHSRGLQATSSHLLLRNRVAATRLPWVKLATKTRKLKEKVA